MRKLILNGRAIYPGANYLYDENSKRDLQFSERRKLAHQVKVGWKVERHL
jgi:hypothetical protein